MSILILSLQHLCSSQFISVFYTATEADSLQVWLYVMFDLFPCWKGCLISFQAPHSPTYLNNITNTLVQQKHRSNQLWILVMDPNLFIYHMWGIPSPLPKHVTFFWLLFHRPPTNSNRTPPNQYIDPMVVCQSHLFISLWRYHPRI